MTPMTSHGKAERTFVKLDLASPLGNDTIGVGTIYNRQAKQWLVWLSPNGLDIIILCAHQNESDANAVVEEVIAAARSGDLAEKEKIPALLGQWRSRGREEPSFSHEMLVAIGRDIRYHVVPLSPPQR